VEQLEKIERKFEVNYDEATNKTEITIYGVIGDSWWDDSVSAADIDKALKDAKGEIVIHLNSPGGDAFDGIAIYNRLKQYNGKVTIYVDGWACSAASIIAMAADELIMGLGAMMMIHEAWTIVWGTKKDLRKEADVLEKLENSIIDIYMTKANVSREEIRRMVDDETWFSAQEAVNIGFATSIIDDKDKEIANLRAQLAAVQSELAQVKNQGRLNEPKPDREQRFIF
jgi:ATP-dependent protease ClpP protease subunit